MKVLKHQQTQENWTISSLKDEFLPLIAGTFLVIEVKITDGKG
ncbi:hypothetical protein [Paenibacillus roseipurpureus]|uniref:Uncharacterized protein n=1 Tax=Paenibacillus roseopurpureus TaxID=2918901 RepID=A0AA96LLS0_9BACL|nr:hypothetical protein [Paenibacillus sp. MBLB1832]WNR43441.1 hypothetical protein MJB10_20365 [Paenibacillus sp. MBLB1832]